jgi:hypothetical protein
VDLFVGAGHRVQRSAFQKHFGFLLPVMDGVRAGGHRMRTRSASGAESHQVARGVAGTVGRIAGLRMRSQLRHVVDLARLRRRV